LFFIFWIFLIFLFDDGAFYLFLQIKCIIIRATRVTPLFTGAGAVGHMRIRWTVEAHVAAQEREIAIGFGKRECGAWAITSNDASP
jgi:hypothetical protein